MSEDKRLLEKLYEILSTLNYNSERRELLEDVLKRFLVEKDPRMNIVSESRNLFNEKVRAPAPSRRQLWFKQECLLLSNIPHQFIPEYITHKFAIFAEEFEKIYNFDMNSLWIFAFKILEYIEFKKSMIGFSDEIYSFKSKKEYADLGFVKKPSKQYIEQWKNVVTIDKMEMRRFLSGILSTYDIERILEIISIDLDSLAKDPTEIRFQSRPILQLGGNLVVLTQWYLSRGLPSTYERLFKKSSRYLNSKGKPFERLVQNTFRKTFFDMLAFNVRYGKRSQFETDAIIGFKKSLWFVEASSHPPSLQSLMGDLSSIRTDLKKTIGKCIEQGKRAIRHINQVPLSCFSRGRAIRGIIIVVDGVYPNLNINTYLRFFSEENIPIYIINWFDLETLIHQPELQLLEEFLIWRTQKPMPVVCFDEKDYWAFYFDRYRVLRDIRKSFNSIQKRGTSLFYISYRFNRKDYLEKLTRAN